MNRAARPLAWHLRLAPTLHCCCPASLTKPLTTRPPTSLQVGVISEPETLQVEITPADKFLVLASDGVWEFITNEEAVAIVGACETVEEACRQLVEEAHNRWLLEEEGVVDDITAVVVQLIHG